MYNIQCKRLSNHKYSIKFIDQRLTSLKRLPKWPFGRYSSWWFRKFLHNKHLLCFNLWFFSRYPISTFQLSNLKETLSVFGDYLYLRTWSFRTSVHNKRNFFFYLLRKSQQSSQQFFCLFKQRKFNWGAIWHMFCFYRHRLSHRSCCRLNCLLHKLQLALEEIQ